MRKPLPPHSKKSLFLGLAALLAPDLASSQVQEARIEMAKSPQSAAFTSAAPDDYLTFIGRNTNTHTVASGDVNGDGKRDLVMGGYGADTYDGRVFVVFGGAPCALRNRDLATEADVTVIGALIRASAPR
jgi:hypothetical protein